MDFPLLEITDDVRAEQWLHKYFHPNGLLCPRCGASVERARRFRQMRRSHVTNYRCHLCDKVYSVYSGTIFANKQLRPTQVILLLRGICKGESTAALARELELAYDTVHHLRQLIHRNALRLQPETPLPDAITETDEMFQNAGEKRRKPS
ncbi:MAG: hypothetical protein EYC68_12160 [Chloroflexota bacterium]|nr:MAG: hypothetical protein EYC68_12160 [Chloroflexota bacterium]